MEIIAPEGSGIDLKEECFFLFWPRRAAGNRPDPRVFAYCPPD